MLITVKASTKVGYSLPVDEAVTFGGHSAGICYLRGSMEEIQNEDPEKTAARVKMTIDNGHHSVYDHPSYSLAIEGIPKLLAMLLNNERVYTTSEKSARYTQMESEGREKELYDKWVRILIGLIQTVYPDIDPGRIQKLAQENARYMTSVFTPTKMQYTASLRQLNYLIHHMRHFVADGRPEPLFEMLEPSISEFVELLEFLRVDGLTDELKDGRLSLFDERASRTEYFGDVYCTTYLGSFAQLAQAHRHRTLDYKMRLTDGDPQFYVPPIVAGDPYLAEIWLEDITSLTDNYPQGMLVSIRERGTYEHFILKMQERLCSAAQLEVSRQTYATLNNYLDAAVLRHDVFVRLTKFKSGARCGAGYRCPNPCSWGVRQQQRLI